MPSRKRTFLGDRCALCARGMAGPSESRTMYTARSRRDAGQPCRLTRKDGAWPAAAQGKHDENDKNRGWGLPWRGFREPHPDGADFRRCTEQQHSADGAARGGRPTGAATTQAFASPYAPRYEEWNAAAGPTIGVFATANEDNRLAQEDERLQHAPATPAPGYPGSATSEY
jgi:hypothetical protein